MGFLSFTYRAHCERHNGEDIPSSKRYWGAWLLGTSQLCIMIACVLSFLSGQGLTETLKDLLEVDIFTGASLVGLNTFMKGLNGLFGSTQEPKDKPVEE